MKFRIAYVKRQEWTVEAESLLWAEVRANEMAHLYSPGDFKILSITQTDPPLPPEPPKPPFVPKPKKVKEDLWKWLDFPASRA